MQYPCRVGCHYFPLLPEYFKPINNFHPSFPDVDSYLEAEDQKAARSIWPRPEILDILLRLPAELSAIVFSFLSPVSLDAARCVSRAWRLRIISDRRILSSVLTLETPSIPEETPKELHRRLLKQLDLEMPSRGPLIIQILGACTFRRPRSSSSSVRAASINIRRLRHTSPTFLQLLYVMPVTSSP